MRHPSPLFPHIDHLIILNISRLAECRLLIQDNRRRLLNNQQLLQPRLNLPQLPPNEKTLISHIIQEILCNFFVAFWVSTVIDCGI